MHNLDGAKEQFYNLNLVLSTQLIEAIKKTYTVGDTIELLCSYNNSYIGSYIKWADCKSAIGSGPWILVKHNFKNLVKIWHRVNLILYTLEMKQ